MYYLIKYFSTPHDHIVAKKYCRWNPGFAHFKSRFPCNSINCNFAIRQCGGAEAANFRAASEPIFWSVGAAFFDGGSGLIFLESKNENPCSCINNEFYQFINTAWPKPESAPGPRTSGAGAAQKSGVSATYCSKAG